MVEAELIEIKDRLAWRL